MMKFKFVPIVLVLIMVVTASLGAFATSSVSSQQAADKPAPALPIPAQILSAKRVFIANHQPAIVNNAGYYGGPDRTYTEFVAAMQHWGHYEMVISPSAADLVFEIEMISRRDAPDQFGIIIRDPKSNVALWTLYQKIEFAGLMSNRDKNFSKAIQRAANQLSGLAGTPPVFPPETPKNDSDDSN